MSFKEIISVLYKQHRLLEDMMANNLYTNSNFLGWYKNEDITSSIDVSSKIVVILNVTVNYPNGHSD